MLIRFMLVFGITSLLCIPAFGQVIERKDFIRPPGSLPGEELYEKDFEIGHGVSEHAKIEVTGKGNGFLEMANLDLRIFKEHDDGAVFEGGLLHVEFIDLTNDGYKDLVISGIVHYTGEKGDLKIYEPITQIYVFNPKDRQYKLKYRLGPDLNWGKDLPQKD